MSKITKLRLVSLRNCASQIQRIGHKNTIILRSEPGCGKTSILTLIAILNGDKWRKVGDFFPEDKYQYIYIDTPTLQYGDITSNIPRHETKTLEEYVGGLFCMDDLRPKVIMFDEMLKLQKMLKPQITRVIRERTVGARPFHEKTIVFGTSNNGEDGVGDTTQAHEGNRVTFLQMAKPSVKEWLAWAADSGINETLMGAVMSEPSLLDSYMSLTTQQLDANPYIFNPNKPQVTFVSPRSLSMASAYLDERLASGDEVAMACIAGCLGEAATHLIETYVSMEKDIVKPEVIIADPMIAPIPDNQIVLLISLFKSRKAIQTQDDLTQYVTYVNRLKSKEVQSVWAMTICADTNLDKFARRNEHLKQFRLENQEYLN
jgi:hypothetical protein